MQQNTYSWKPKIKNRSRQMADKINNSQTSTFMIMKYQIMKKWYYSHNQFQHYTTRTSSILKSVIQTQGLVAITLTTTAISRHYITALFLCLRLKLQLLAQLMTYVLPLPKCEHFHHVQLCFFPLYDMCLEFRKRSNSFKQKTRLSLLIYVNS